MPITAPFYRWRPHPWHGLDPGPDPPKTVQAYIEITPFDLVKYEVDKTTGYVRVDRPQSGSSQPPTLYGFIPQTYCGRRVSSLSPKSTKGDSDPLDICVISERPITRAEVIVTARVVGGLQVVDNEEADDKIIAVLANDNIWSNAMDVRDVPDAYVQRLQHYFSTYKLVPDSEPIISIESVYGRDQALKVISASLEDYDEEFGRGA
jgi:inorganic pyrophosphatase